jgi:hypothetical protein
VANEQQFLSAARRGEGTLEVDAHAEMITESAQRERRARG